MAYQNLAIYLQLLTNLKALAKALTFTALGVKAREVRYRAADRNVVLVVSWMVEVPGPRFVNSTLSPKVLAAFNSSTRKED